MPVVLRVSALLAVFIVLVVGLQQLGGNARLDLTEQKLYTLSDGTRSVLQTLEQPLQLTLYFSRSAATDLIPLRAYAQRVEELLAEYELAANGKLQVQVIDPVPYSDEEDQATAFGLQAVPVSGGLEQLYFGVVVQRAGDSNGAFAVQPFLQPGREAFLEYELTQLIYQIQQKRAPVIGLLSGLDVLGGFDMRTGQPNPAWMALEQLQNNYEVRSLTASTDVISEEIDILLLIQPPELTEETLYGIDQFALNGGRVMVFIDPLAETSPAGGMMGMNDPASASSLTRLLSQWGVGWNPDEVVLDAQQALVVNQGPGRPPMRHLGILGVSSEFMASADVITAQLDTVNLSSSGHLTLLDGRTTQIEPWLLSSEDAMLTDPKKLEIGADLMLLQREFVPAGETYVFAAHLMGTATTAFAEGINGKKRENHRDRTDALAVSVIADTDILSDRLWVQVQDFFGRRMASPWADNGDLLINLADHLSGSAELMSLRARGQYSRPFERVSELRMQAEQRFLLSEQRLQQQLEETEQQLAELQEQRSDDGTLTLSPEQQAALTQFQRQKLEIRRELRSVQHELNKDIEQLGTWLKVLNIFVLPVLFTLLMGLIAWLYRKRQAL